MTILGLKPRIEKIACAKACGWKTKGGLTAARTAASAARHARLCKGV